MKKVAPKSGGRGTRDKDKPRDKNVRITSELFDEMMRTAVKRAMDRGEYNTDFHDICSEVWEFWKKEHKQEKEKEKKK
jgi:hypothetical protein